MTKTTSPYLALERRIAADERGGVLHRWRYGRQLLEAKADRKQLPHGMLADLVAAAAKAGLPVSEREIRRRVQCAEAHGSEAKVGQALADFGTWSALAEAGFPAVESDEPDDLEAAGVSTGAPDEYEQLTLIPGLAPVLSVAGRKVPLEDATIADVEAYRDMYSQIHANYGKRLALIEAALEAMRDGSDGDDTANAVEAWKRATGDDEVEQLLADATIVPATPVDAVTEAWPRTSDSPVPPGEVPAPGTAPASVESALRAPGAGASGGNGEQVA